MIAPITNCKYLGIGVITSYTNAFYTKRLHFLLKPNSCINPPFSDAVGTEYVPSSFVWQGRLAPCFQFAHRSWTVTPAKALSTCMPHPTHEAFPQLEQERFEHMLEAIEVIWNIYVNELSKYRVSIVSNHNTKYLMHPPPIVRFFGSPSDKPQREISILLRSSVRTNQQIKSHREKSCTHKVYKQRITPCVSHGTTMSLRCIHGTGLIPSRYGWM